MRTGADRTWFIISRLGILLVFVLMPLMRRDRLFTHVLTDGEKVSISTEATKAMHAGVTHCPYDPVKNWSAFSEWYDAWNREFAKDWLQKFGKPFGQP